jgi:non-specific serine/threonine protein kinase
VIALEVNDFDGAVGYLEESAVAAREAEDAREELAALGNLAVVFSRRGEQERAADMYEQVVSTAIRIHDDGNHAFALSNLGITREQLGQLDQAETALAEALRLLDRLDWKEGLVYTLSGLARVRLRLDAPRRAARLLSAAERLGDSIELAWQTDEAKHRDGTKTRLRETLGAAFELTWAEVAVVPVEDVIADKSAQPVSILSDGRP